MKPAARSAPERRRRPGRRAAVAPLPPPTPRRRGLWKNWPRLVVELREDVAQLRRRVERGPARRALPRGWTTLKDAAAEVGFSYEVFAPVGGPRRDSRAPTRRAMDSPRGQRVRARRPITGDLYFCA